MFNHMLSPKRSKSSQLQLAAAGTRGERRCGGRIVPSAAATRIHLYQILSSNAIKDGRVHQQRGTSTNTIARSPSQVRRQIDVFSKLPTSLLFLQRFMFV